MVLKNAVILVPMLFFRECLTKRSILVLSILKNIFFRILSTKRFAIKVNVKKELRFDRSTVILKLLVTVSGSCPCSSFTWFPIVTKV